ncbi:adenosylcobinamide-GDP ribazoletransferase [Chryseobacterium sp. BIGb0232]|uniref:adenosylcobinamide-GDP ribazoletransferase n=1 Tax=Chryseobacterium sp. BIGb0232 TaxID=2940598 RepID=UPI000F4ABA84|nr:adenosylcobinamide-GDP ribazoletransferase [Chryseobacterium sp. BIGb0232]MCS4302336.1 adenosylcobinamide-GDP ribazoletransferase [Chryseobacterium sp. BIGb0232]ROS18281.1 cobalamin-5'-phosphate synthase [Chryseobacterium nakagawai]
MKTLKNELIYFATALMFFTRIPIPFTIPYSGEIMNKSQKYFAWIGLLVGLINAGILYLFSQLFNLEIGIVLMMIGSVLLTGAFHEDGFTDMCDSFGGGYGKEKILTIMKDSRVGAYGTIGIILLFALKFFSIQALGTVDLIKTLGIVILAHTSSRFISGTMIYTHQYVTDIDVSKSKPLANKPLDGMALLVSFMGVLLSFALIPDWRLILAFALAYLGKICMGWYFKKHIGGYTGDCLGAVQQVTEVLFYLGTMIVWKFI